MNGAIIHLEDYLHRKPFKVLYMPHPKAYFFLAKHKYCTSYIVSILGRYSQITRREERNEEKRAAYIGKQFGFVPPLIASFSKPIGKGIKGFCVSPVVLLSEFQESWPCKVWVYSS